MRKFIYIIVGLAVLTGCKTNERNMAEAYNLAVAGDDDNPGLDATIYSQIRRQMNHSSMVVNGDTVDVATHWISPTEGGGGIRESIKAYNVVVGQFKQLFNAKSMRERLLDRGYPGAFVVQTSEPYYYVVAAAYNDASEATQALKRIDSDPSLPLKSPLPFILQPASYGGRR